MKKRECEGGILFFSVWIDKMRGVSYLSYKNERGSIIIYTSTKGLPYNKRLYPYKVISQLCLRV